MQFDEGEFADSVDGHKQVELTSPAPTLDD
jgi:hypothetical protein